MAKEKAVYSPGELSRVRNKLGSLDDSEAKRMAKLLGGEVGVEKSPESQGASRSSRAAPLARKSRQEKVEVVVGRGGTGRPRQPSRSPSGSGSGWNQVKKSSASRRGEGGDDPRSPVKVSYWERVKMDRCAAQPEFDIKSPAQALGSALSLFNAPADTVSSVFVTKRMAEYY